MDSFDIKEGLTFDDVLLLPDYSEVLPHEVSTATNFTRRIKLQIPLCSSAMDTVTEANLAIALAQQGGIGVIHKNLSIERQAEEVDKVKRSESGMIVDPVTIFPDRPVSAALGVMENYKISGVPVVDKDGVLVGIITNRDLRFETRYEIPVSEVMTPQPLVTVPVGTTLDAAKSVLQKHRIEKLLVIDETGHLKGLITVKDIQKAIKYPLAAKDELGRLRVGAAIGAAGDFAERAAELIKNRVDCIVIDTAHGHSSRVIEAVRRIRRDFPETQIVAGNIATGEAAKALVKAGVDAIKVGIGPGSICTTRVVTGAGVPQISAIMECIAEARPGRHSGHRRRRREIFRRYRKSHRGGRGYGNDRLAFCRDGRISRRDHSLPGQDFQILPRDGFDRRDETGLKGPLLTGRHDVGTKAGARRDRGARGVQRNTGRYGHAAGRRPARGNGLHGLPQYRRAAGQSEIHPHHLRGLARISCARRDNNQGSFELQIGELGAVVSGQNREP